jgi:hypothetical protein
MKRKQKLNLSKKSDFKSAELKIGKEYIEIFLQPDNKKLIIYLEELKKIVKAYIYTVIQRAYKGIIMVLERIFQRRRWLNKTYFELASLLNLLLSSTNISNNNSHNKVEKLTLIRETAGRVLKNYKRKLYNKVKKISVQNSDAEKLSKNLLKTAEIIHGELIKIHKPYARHVKVKELMKGILKEYNLIEN